MRQYVHGSDAGMAVQAAPAEQLQLCDGDESVFTAPVETLLEMPLQVAGQDDDSSTGSFIP